MNWIYKIFYYVYLLPKLSYSYYSFLYSVIPTCSVGATLRGDSLRESFPCL